VLNLGESVTLVTLSPEDQTLAADVILLVDESSSMVMEHDWIPGMIRELDTALQEVNVGRVESNRFGLVGFGGDCSDGVGLGRVLSAVGGAQFSFSTNFTELSEGLSTSGRREDGYSAIYTALMSYPPRPGAARQFILVTDEDRDVVDGNLTRDSIAAALSGGSVMLNVAVNEEFSAGGTGALLRALGIDSYGRGYVYDPSSPAMYRVVEGEGEAVRDSGHGNTHRDYTQLALDTGGGAWDLSILRHGNAVAVSFTAAFVRAKVEEIVSQLSRCFNCSCTPSGPLCTPSSLCQDDSAEPPKPDSPLSLKIDPQLSGPLVAETLTDVRLTCSADNSTATVVWTFNGGQVPANSQLESPEPGVKVLQLSQVTQGENGGVYACLAHLGETYNAAATIELEIYGEYHYGVCTD
jgi:hypothetical protein